MNEHRPPAVEAHGIDFVPLTERYGTPYRLFTIWFSTNLSIICVAAGTLGVAAGLGFVWTVAAITIGNAIGTVFMAAHSAQGPHLGVPQMIQSRAQFGVLGAGLPLLAVVVTYLLGSASDSLIAQGILVNLAPLGGNESLLLFGIASLLVAFMGYQLIHIMGAVVTYTSGALFLVAACILLFRGTGPSMLVSGTALHYNTAIFTLTITQAASWTLSFGPYVADYSRYLPENVSDARTFWYTGAGCFLGSTLMMVLGAYIAWISPALARDIGSTVANIFGSGRAIAQVVLVVGMLLTNVMNVYSAYMSTASILSGVRRMERVGNGRKFVLMAFLTVIATFIALAVQDNFQAYFADVLNAALYLLVPWSAINLADYYLVRDGRYNINDLFRVEGIYGAYRWKTIGVYIVSIGAQEPFMKLSFFSGAVAQRLGVDVAWIPGLIVPAVLYVLVERRTRREKSCEFAS